MAWEPPTPPLPPPTGRPAEGARRFDDGAFRAALDRFSSPLGFRSGDDAATDVVHRHDIVHPGGISMRCTVLGENERAATAKGIATLGLFVLGVAVDVLSGGHGAAEVGPWSVGGRVHAEYARRLADGQSVDDLGHPAVWTGAIAPEPSSLSVLTSGRLLTIEIWSAADPVEQYGWLRACALAVLPTV